MAKPELGHSGIVISRATSVLLGPLKGLLSPGSAVAPLGKPCSASLTSWLSALGNPDGRPLFPSVSWGGLRHLLHAMSVSPLGWD